MQEPGGGRQASAGGRGRGSLAVGSLARVQGSTQRTRSLTSSFMDLSPLELPLLKVKTRGSAMVVSERR